MLLCILQIFGCLCAPIFIILIVGTFCSQTINISCCCCCLIINASCIIIFDIIIATFFGMCIFIILSSFLIFLMILRILMLTFPTALNLWRNLPLRLTYPEITYLIERYCRLIMFRISQMNVFFTPFSIIENMIWNLMRKKFG